MKLLFVLAITVAVVAARRHHIPRVVPESLSTEREVKNHDFQSKGEFQFLYNAQILTGVPQSSQQHSGSRLQCLCKVQVTPTPEEGDKTATTIRLQLEKIQVAELFNRHVPVPRAMLPIEACDKVEIREKLMEQLRLPVELKYSDGMISDIRFDEQDQSWSTNIKRGVLNLLQVRLNNLKLTRPMSQRELQTNDEIKPIRPHFDHFTVEEETVEGWCNTTYTMMRSGPTLLNVTKSINFENCRARPEIRYNFRFAEPCPGCDKKLTDSEKFLESSTVIRYNITGDLKNGFVIDSACAEGQYIFTPYNEQSNVIVTYTNQTLVLFKSQKQLSANIPKPNSPKTGRLDGSLMYSTNWDLKKERFMQNEEGEFLNNNPYALRSVDQKKLVFTMLRLLSKQMLNNGHSHVRIESPQQLVRLVKVLRLVNEEKLTEVYESAKDLPKPQKHVAIDMFVDGLGICGTKSCLVTLLKLIKEKKVNIIKGSLSLKSLIQARTVSEPMITEMKDFCEEDVCKSSGICYQSCLLTTGSMIGALCKRSEDLMAREFQRQYLRHNGDKLSTLKHLKTLCPKSLRVQYKEYLIKKLKEQTTDYQKVLLLKTISNAALPECIRPLEKIIVNAKKVEKTVIRTQAIEALRQLNRRAPRSVRRVLMPVYLNVRELPELRMVALHQILQTLPPRQILDQIAQNLVQEKSSHVAGFTITYLRSLANSTNPCEKRMADDLKLSLRHANMIPETILPFLSRFQHWDVYSRKYRSGVGLDLGVMKSNMSYVPHDAAISVHGTAWGFWRKYLLTLGVVQHDFDRMVWNMMGVDGSILEQKMSQLRRSTVRTTSTLERAKQLKKIFSDLKINKRSYMDENEVLSPIGMLYMRFIDQEYALLPLSEDTIMNGYKNLPATVVAEITKMIKTGQVPRDLDMKMLQKLLSNGYQFNYQTGAMLRELTRKIPTPVGMPVVFSMKVPAILSIRNGQIKPSMKGNGKYIINLKGKPSIASSVILNMEVWSPIVNTGVRAIAQLMAQMPVDMKVIADVEGQIPLQVSLRTPTKYRRTLLNLKSTPSTFTRVWPIAGPETKMGGWVHSVHRTILGEEWNRRQTFNTVIGRSAFGVGLRIRGQYHRTPTAALPGTPWCLLSGPNHIVITATQGIDPPKQVEIKLTSRLFQKMKKLGVSKTLKEFIERTDISSSEFETSSSEELEGLEEVVPKEYMGVSSQHLVKLDVVTKGSKKQRLVRTTLDAKCQHQGSKNGGGKRCLATLKLLRSSVSDYDTHYPKNVNFEVDCLVSYPEIPFTMAELTKDKKVSVALSAKYGPVGSEQRIAEIRILGERSVEQHNLLQDSLYYRNYQNKAIRDQFSSIFSPLSQYDQLVKASALTQFKVIARCDVPKVLKVCPNLLNVTAGVYRLLKHMTYWNSEVDQLIQKNRPVGTVKALIKLDPRSFQLFNLTVQTPVENLNVTDVPLPCPVFPLNLRDPSQSLMSTRVIDQLMPTCSVNSRRVRTFDGVQFGLPLQCAKYSVLAKDCSSKTQPRFVVLMRRLGLDTHDKVVKIITHHDDEIVLKSKRCDSCINNIQVKVNGEVKSGKELILHECADQQCLISRETRHIIRVELPKTGVIVHFDGQTARIQISPYYNGLQCGVCGHFDGETMDEFRTAEGVITQSRSTYYKSFLYPHSDTTATCSLQKDLLDNEEQYWSRDLEWERLDLDDESVETSDDDIYTPVRQLTKKNVPKCTHVIDRLDQETGRLMYCFSVQPRPYCPNNMMAEKIKKISTTYKCISSDLEKSHELMGLARRHQIIDVEQEMSEIEVDLEDENDVVTINLPIDTRFPTKCVSLY